MATTAERLPVNIEDEMKRSYMDYAMSVIIGRALPDVRDGLKPVHRRVLYAMYREGLLSNRAYSKCAGIVGEVLKKYHPFLSGELPDGEEVIDHAAGHLVWRLPMATPIRSAVPSSKLRHVLLEDDKGVEKVIRSLVHLRDTYPRRKKIARELKYFRRNRHRMRYAVLKKQGLPIGSGVTEAACKTLATQRLKRSGMRWGEQGGQAILSFRALVQSNRFERAWTLFAHTYKAEVTALDNVVPIRMAPRLICERHMDSSSRPGKLWLCRWRSTRGLSIYRSPLDGP